MVSRRKGVLTKKLVRDMRQNAMQFIAMLLLCFLGTWCYSGLDGSWRMFDKTVETYISDCNLADFWVKGSSISKQDISRVKNISGVKSVLARTSLEVDVEDVGDSVTAALMCYDGEMTINKPYLRSGSLLEPSDIRGCLMEEQFAAAHNLSPGDTVTITVSGIQMTFVVRGTVLSAEYAITSKDTAPDPEHYGFLMISSQAVPALPTTDILVDLTDDADADAVQAEIEKLVPSALVISQKTHQVTTTVRSYPQMFHGLTYIFPVLAFAVASLIVVSTLNRMIENQRIQIGTLKALGYGNGQIRRHYVWYALVPSIFGSIIGLYVGRYTLPDVLWKIISNNARYPYKLRADISPQAYAMTVLNIVLSVIICLYAFRKAARECTASLLRPKPPKSGTRILLERFTRLWSRLSFNSKMIVRNLMRNKGRTFISLMGILFCNMLIICTFGLQESIAYFMGQYYGGTLQYELRLDMKSGQTGTLESYQKRLDAGTVEGIMELSVSLHGGNDARVCRLTVLKDGQTCIHLGENQTILDMPDEGLVISRKLAKVMGISLGDEVNVYLTGDTEPLTLTIRDFAETNAGQGLFMSESAWEKCRKGNFTLSAMLIRDPSAMCLHKIDEMDEVSTVKYLNNQFSQAMRIMDSMSTAFGILSGAALGLAFVICYNMGLLNFTERTRDYATLKVLGYHQREIRSLMLRENNIVAVLGTLIGIPPGIILVDVILKTCEYDSMVFVSYVSPKSVLMASVITFCFSVFIEWLLTRKVRGIDMVEALKSVE